MEGKTLNELALQRTEISRERLDHLLALKERAVRLDVLAAHYNGPYTRRAEAADDVLNAAIEELEWK